MKNYILSFENTTTHETKEYYKAIYNDEDIRKIALLYIDTFNLDKSTTRIFIYELKDVIYEDDTE